MKQPLCNKMLSKGTSFLKKYFMEGQKLEDKQQQALETLPQDAPFMTNSSQTSKNNRHLDSALFF